MSAVDEIKDRLDIVEVVSSYIPLQKGGRNFKALCPFHAEKTPSFVVFPDTQRWHCFGACGEGGDIFNFVMKQEGWDFRTAVSELARRAGVELRPRTPAQEKVEKEADRLRELLAAAAQYYHHLLGHAPQAEEGRAYITRRGLSDETVERFLLGYSPAGWERTRVYLAERGYTAEEQLNAGLLVQQEAGASSYDRFRDRLMIPIRDTKGRVIGFGARTLSAEGVPKYLNSPQTALFDKSGTLFGLDMARQSIHRQDHAIIVEGYMDVMQAHQAGFANVVAQMGTAVTEPQLLQLQRYTKRLTLALDPDAAGIQATLRGVEVAREALEQEWEPVFDPRGLVGYEARLEAEIRVLRLPRGNDPDDVIRESPEKWAALVEDAMPVVDFYLQLLLEDLDLEDTKAKAQVVDTLVPVLRAVANPVEREDYAQKIARALRVDARAVSARFRRTERQTARRQRATALAQEAPISGETQADLESHCLSTLLQRRDLLSQVNQALDDNELEPMRAQDFQNVGSRAIFEAWETLLANANPNPVEALHDQLPADLQTRLEELVVPGDSQLADEQLVRDLGLTFLRLRERNLSRLGQELGQLTREAQESGDLRAQEYAAAWRSHTTSLRRTWKALAQRWRWMS
jgi:DNA primase